MTGALRVLVFPIDATPHARSVTGLADMQAIVGGYIETVGRNDQGLVLVGNEEGQLLGLPSNPWALLLFGVRLFGPLFLARFDADSEFAALTEDDLALYGAASRAAEAVRRSMS